MSMKTDRLDLQPIDTEGCLIAIGAFVAAINLFVVVYL